MTPLLGSVTKVGVTKAILSGFTWLRQWKADAREERGTPPLGSASSLPATESD